MSKFTDFFETVTYVLMKRFDMINLYHVAHHSIMPVSSALHFLVIHSTGDFRVAISC